jgi:DNA-binding PadR family transcriptional regulator
MSLSHTILTFLSEAPHSGYDLNKHFEDAVSCFWKASHQQIYRELAKMESLGWVESEIVPQQGKPDKKLYHITPKGLQELERWFELPCAPTQVREDLLVKVLAGDMFPRSILIKHLIDRRSFHQSKLDCYRTQEQSFLQLENPEDRLRFRYFTLRRGIRHESEWVDWCDEILAEIGQIPKSIGDDKKCQSCEN